MTALWLAVPLALGLVGEVAGEYRQVKTAVHVHTRFSTGTLDLDQLVEEARRREIGALVLADNFLLRFEYGLFPLRRVVRKVVEMPSVLGMKAERYLGAIEAAQARFPDVVLVPGVEVMPYYYWTGSLLTGDLTQHDAQKNLLVVGLSRPEDYARLPAIGNSDALARNETAHVTLALSVVTICVGLVLLRARTERVIRLQRFQLAMPRRYRLPGLALLGIGGLLAVEALGSRELHPYRGPLGLAPHQAVIDFVQARGGLALWSFPEARDRSRHSFGRLGTVTIRTDPHPEVLLQSHGYTGFGAVYPDTVTFTEPGEHWDRLLRAHAEGARARPAWGVGEVGYHGPPKPLDDALTVALVTGPTRASLLAALRAGRFYAVRPGRDYHLVLEEFSIEQAGGAGPVPMGGALVSRGSAPLAIRLRLAASDRRAVPVALRLIRSGTVVEALEGLTPFATTLEVAAPSAGRREFYRLEVTRPHRLLANPIFVGGAA